MDWIELKNMRFYAYHGVLEQERTVGNNYTVNLRLGLSLAKAAESDALEDTVDYAAVYALVAGEMAVSSRLIEHLASRILQSIKKNFPAVESVEIRLSKQNPPFGGDLQEVAVVLSA
jgi:dihydroneopterin aldolase